jgi:hypothetical protein
VDATIASSLLDIAVEGLYYFSIMFKEESRATIDIILKVSNFFPRFINMEGKIILMA